MSSHHNLNCMEKAVQRKHSNNRLRAPKMYLINNLDCTKRPKNVETLRDYRMITL